MCKIFKKLGIISFATLMFIGVGASNSNIQVGARHRRYHRVYRHHVRRGKRSSVLHLSYKGSETVKLTKPVRVDFVHMAYYPIMDRSIKHKVLPRGTVLHAWYKGTEGVVWCVNGSRARMSKNVWPSANLTKRNCRVIHNYKYRYGYEYMMKKFHEWY